MHTNIAVRDLKNYADKYFDNTASRPVIELAEFTINQPVGEVLRGIASYGADWILFSTYIWNAEYVTKLLPEIKKVLPDCVLGAGGPEPSPAEGVAEDTAAERGGWSEGKTFPFIYCKILP